MALHTNLFAIGLLLAALVAGCTTENSQEPREATSQESTLMCGTTKTDNADGTATFTESCELVPNVCEYMDVSGRTWTDKCN